MFLFHKAHWQAGLSFQMTVYQTMNSVKNSVPKIKFLQESLIKMAKVAATILYVFFLPVCLQISQKHAEKLCTWAYHTIGKKFTINLWARVTYIHCPFHKHSIQITETQNIVSLHAWRFSHDCFYLHVKPHLLFSGYQNVVKYSTLRQNHAYVITKDM